MKTIKKTGILCLLVFSFGVYASPPPVVVFAVGDIARCDVDSLEPRESTVKTQQLMEKLLKEDRNKGAIILALGDLAYGQGTERQFGKCYEKSWGQFKDITYPVTGNHEYYEKADANYQEIEKEFGIEPYQAYWSEQFGRIKKISKNYSGSIEDGYYKFDLGAWRLIGLNTEVIVADENSLLKSPKKRIKRNTKQRIGEVKMSDESKARKKEQIKQLKRQKKQTIAGIEGRLSALQEEFDRVQAGQNKWLANDAFTNKPRCMLAFAHHPKFSSGSNGSDPRLSRLYGLYKTLHEEGTSVILSGHDHHYERVRRVNAAQQQDDKKGLRTFVVGTGGGRLRDIHRPHHLASEYVFNGHGVMRLELSENAYMWEFISVAKEDEDEKRRVEEGQVVDSGSERCVPRKN